MLWQVNHGLPEIRKPLVSAHGNITGAKLVDVPEGICVSLNYVVSAFVCLREREEFPESKRRVGKRRLFHVNDRPNCRYVNADTQCQYG